MPTLVSTLKSTKPQDLLERGRQRVKWFCQVNKLPEPVITVTPRLEWWVDACAYYRPIESIKRLPSGINICVELCARVCGEANSRNWNWPGSTTDRTPHGVVAHELGHHCDYVTGKKKWTYGSEYCEEVMEESGEAPITSYAPNPSEWFAEIMRLFITNHALLRAIRPKAWEIISRKFKPVSCDSWLKELGSHVPDRVVKALKNKMR